MQKFKSRHDHSSGGGVCARSGRCNRTVYRNGLLFSSSHTFATSSVARAVASRQPAPLAPLSPIRNIPCSYYCPFFFVVSIAHRLLSSLLLLYVRARVCVSLRLCCAIVEMGDKMPSPSVDAVAFELDAIHVRS